LILAETTSSWTGQKKTKIQRTPTSREHSSGKIADGQEQEREEIDGLDWDDDKLVKEIDGCLLRLKDTPYVYNEGAIDNDSLDLHDEQQLRVLNERLALCRIRAHEEKYKDTDNETLSRFFPPDNLKADGYYLHYELSFEWYFDPLYCQYAIFQDYQRLMLRNNGEYEDWEYYRRTCSTLEGDQEYVQFWETLSSKSELIEWYVTRKTYESRVERLLHYHTLKIAAAHPHLLKTLVNSGCIEFRRSLQIQFIWTRPCAEFLFEMWKLLTGEQLTFKDALGRVFHDEKYSFMFAVKTEFQPNLRPLEKVYKPILDGICKKSAEEAEGWIKDYVTETARKPKTYYDYAKKKLDISEKIGLIPPAPQKVQVTKPLMVTS
jgi:hypothetical protein